MKYNITMRSYQTMLKMLMKRTQISSPQGIKTYEIIGSVGKMNNALDRVITDRDRKINIAFALAEFYGTLFGIDDIQFYKTFIKGYDMYSSDGKSLDGCYGTRISFLPDEETPIKSKITESDASINQIMRVIGILKESRFSRRAIVDIYKPSDTFGGGGKNTPCTLSLQFLVRTRSDGRDYLDCIGYMRSNDMWRGFPYDIFNFTMIQEFVARNVNNVVLGSYHHHVGSLHLYDSDLEDVKNIGDEYRWSWMMNPMPPMDSQIGKVREMVQSLPYCSTQTDRSRWVSDLFTLSRSGKYGAYTSTHLAIMACFAWRYIDEENCLECYRMIKDKTLKFVFRPWLKSVKLSTKGFKL